MNKKLLLLTLVNISFLVLPATAQEVSTTWNNRHHLGFVLGYVKLVGGDLKDDFQGYNFSNTFHYAITYRYSLKSYLDLAIEHRGLMTLREDMHLPVSAGFLFTDKTYLDISDLYFGGGVRLNAGSKKIKPFLQGNLYYVVETANVGIWGSFVGIPLEQVRNFNARKDGGVGVGLNGGIDIRVRRKGGFLVSIPVEANYLFAGLPRRTILVFGSAGETRSIPRSTLNGFGISAGININFGWMP